MVDVKGFNGGLNTDSSDELLPGGDYKYAMNINNGDAGITKLLGNRLLDGVPANTLSGNEWVCGFFFDKKRNRVIYFTNHEGGRHRIISYALPSDSYPNGVYTVLFEDSNSIFADWDNYSQYNPDALIKDIKVIHREYEGDLYYFIDPKKRLLKFNYDTLLKYKTGDNTLCAFNWTDGNYTGTTFRNGDTIPQVTDPIAWAGLTTPGWCWYNNDPANETIYGKLYNWYAINDPRGFAPVGYRVPSDTDWSNLVTCLGGESIAGGKLKSKDLWVSPNIGATNESLFNAIPSGIRNYDDGTFVSIGYSGCWWSSTEFNIASAWVRYITYDYSDAFSNDNYKKNGLSVRLIKEV